MITGLTFPQVSIYVYLCRRYIDPLKTGTTVPFTELTPDSFERYALNTFVIQYKEVLVYREFCRILGKNPDNVSTLKEIPFLPVHLFARHCIIRENQQPELIFESSGTTGSIPSKHYVSDAGLYRASFRKCFSLFYGDITNYTVIALLPSYLERKNASLVYMANDWIQQSGQPESGFYLNNQEELYQMLLKLIAQNRQTLFLGVTFALLDFAEKYTLPKNDFMIMETGGMKGRRKEPVRSEIHAFLKEKLGVAQIHSEYGMTELLSQAYAQKDGHFYTPPWMRILIRDPEDPLSFLADGKTGGINIIDLANLNSCAFLATQDLGKRQADGGFEVLGRFDDAEIRGCNLMI